MKLLQRCTNVHVFLLVQLRVHFGRRWREESEQRRGIQGEEPAIFLGIQKQLPASFFLD